MLVPTLAEFLERTADGQRMPVYRDVLADIETPLSAYWKLAHDQTYSFLLESVTGGEQVSRYSFIGVRPRDVVRSKDGHVRHLDGSRHPLPEGQDPLDLLRGALAEPLVEVPGLPTFVGGWVGTMAYDMVRYFERLPDTTKDELEVDDLAMMLADTIVVFDHAKNLIRVVVAAKAGEDGYLRAQAEIEWVLSRLAGPLPVLPGGRNEPHEVNSNVTAEQFGHMVTRMVDYIRAGDGVQMVPAQRFETKVEAHPVTIYRALRSINPSPYMFILRFGDFDVVGASPELLVGLHGRSAHVRPIAGTRWRGATPAEDVALGEELLADEKERAEHVMLVDLGRNDLGRVCRYGTVKVNELMVIERYSHVMHIVSDVTGELAEDKDAFDLIRATFPAGTVTGAPKVRAMQVIDELEPTRRGLYAGAVGFLSNTGDVDLCITLRTIFLKNGMAYVQAGGGVTSDSKPDYEYRESCNKAKAALRAIEMAQRGL